MADSASPGTRRPLPVHFVTEVFITLGLVLVAMAVAAHLHVSAPLAAGLLVGSLTEHPARNQQMGRSMDLRTGP